jgi:hypothetical protein
MTSRTEDRGRRRWLPLGLAFLLGLFIGWWIIGWWFWPVTYTNALPPDLRSEEKGQYLQMVADSYAQTGDLKTAQDRTLTWSKDQLGRDLATVQARLAADGVPIQAENAQRLASALGVAGAQPAPAPTPAASEQPSLFQRFCPAVLWILLALAGIALLVWLYSQWRLRSGKPAPPPAPAPRSAPSAWPASPPTSPVDEIAGAEEGRWDEPDRIPETEDDFDQAPTVWEPVSASSADVEPTSRGASTSAPVAAAAAGAAARGESPTQPETAAGHVAAPKYTKVGEFLATYNAGEPDYDEGFDIKDTSDAVVAMCGLGLMSPVGRGSDQAAALQVWLWEKSDQFTQVQVLMSENAYKDTALREQLAEEYPSLPIRQGTEFDMQTHGFLLHGIVERIIYEEGEEINRIFNHLAVRLRVLQKERA